MLAETGLLDEQNFGQGYGEEDDLVLRARKLGWRMVVADDAYVYHAQSRSYSSEQRKKLSEHAGLALREKHGGEIIRRGVDYCLNSPVLHGIRARAAAMLERERLIQLGRRYAGKRILIVLPIIDPGGGGNVVVFESRALKKMGVEVEIFNEPANHDGFLRGYPDLPVPVRFGVPSMLPELSRQYDAIVATHNRTVAWLQSVRGANPDVTLGYYIQGFEPLMYDASMRAAYMQALQSYTLIPDMVRFTKTEWTRDEVLRHTGAEATVIGVDGDIDLFRPRPNEIRDRTDRPLRLAAMIRPDSPYREPEQTMQLLKRAHATYGSRIEPVIFGTSIDSPGFLELTHDFPWKLYGVLPSQKMANLLTSVDIFVDYSSHQAMGLTALEAMASGCAVILPEHGGAGAYLRHRENGMLADTSDFEAVWSTLRTLIDDGELRRTIQQQAIRDVCNYPPERAALNILRALFGPAPETPPAVEVEPEAPVVVSEPALAVNKVQLRLAAAPAPEPEPQYGEVCEIDDVADASAELPVSVPAGSAASAESDARVLDGIRALEQVADERKAQIQAGRQFAGKKVLFLLPVMFPGGGANIVNIESRALPQDGGRCPDLQYPAISRAIPQGLSGSVRPSRI